MRAVRRRLVFPQNPVFISCRAVFEADGARPADDLCQPQRAHCCPSQPQWGAKVKHKKAKECARLPDEAVPCFLKICMSVSSSRIKLSSVETFPTRGFCWFSGVMSGGSILLSCLLFLFGAACLFWGGAYAAPPATWKRDFTRYPYYLLELQKLSLCLPVFHLIRRY